MRENPDCHPADTGLLRIGQGGTSVMRGLLKRRGNGLPDQSFGLNTPCDLDFADAAFVRAPRTKGITGFGNGK